MRTFVLDTETTGLIENRTAKDSVLPEIIEFYGTTVDLDTGEVFGELERLIKPQKPVSEEITRITGLDDKALIDAPSFAFESAGIQAIIEAAPVVIAHNLSFDREMLDIEFGRLGKAIRWPPRLICSVEATVHMTGYRLSLTALHELLFGAAFPSAHRAKNDVMALVKCCIELRKRGEL